MSEIDQIIKAAIELQQEGKTPSTALLKVRTQKKFNLPLLIQGLKAFKSLKPQQYSKWFEVNTPTDPVKVETIEVTLTDRVKQLESQVTELLRLQQQMQARLNQLES